LLKSVAARAIGYARIICGFRWPSEMQWRFLHDHCINSDF
jgi:hypothetical protein